MINNYFWQMVIYIYNIYISGTPLYFGGPPSDIAQEECAAAAKKLGKIYLGDSWRKSATHLLCFGGHNGLWKRRNVSIYDDLWLIYC